MENFSLFYSNEEDALLSYADIRSPFSNNFKDFLDRFKRKRVICSTIPT